MIKVIEPCDYVIQRSKRAKPQVVHGDKLKRHYGEPLPDWSTERPDDRQSTVNPEETKVKAATSKCRGFSLVLLPKAVHAEVTEVVEELHWSVQGDQGHRAV